MSTSAVTSAMKAEPGAIDDAAAVFALSRPADGEQSRFARFGGKLSRFLARNVATKTLAMRNDRPLATFTFDDAPASACAIGAALLERYQVHGTFYISGGGCGLMSPGGRLASAEQLKALYAAGHEIGCHTFSHVAVGAVSRNTLIAELERNRIFLQGIHRDIGVRNFAYPYGDLSFAAKQCCGSAFQLMPITPSRCERRSYRSRGIEELRTPELLDRTSRHSRHHRCDRSAERMVDLCQS